MFPSSLERFRRHLLAVATGCDVSSVLQRSRDGWVRLPVKKTTQPKTTCTKNRCSSWTTRGFGMTRERFAVLDQKAESADLNHLTLRRSFHADRSHVTFFFFVSVVVAAACDFFCAQRRASMRERMRSGTQLDGTVVAWCCVLPLLPLL